MNNGVGGVVTVVVRRDERGWLAEAAGFGAVRARTLHTVVRLARELIAGAGLAESIEYQFHTGDAELDRLVIQIRAARLAAQRLEVRARRLTSRVLTLPSGGSVRDLALLVGLSHQSVHLLMRRAGEERRAWEENGSYGVETEVDRGGRGSSSNTLGAISAAIRRSSTGTAATSP